MGLALQKVFKTDTSERPIGFKIGVVFVLFGMMLRLPAYLYLPLTTISILSSLTAAISLFVDKRLFSETGMSYNALLSASLILIGSLMVIVIVDLHTEEDGAIDRFWDNLVKFEGVTVAVIVAILLIAYIQFKHIYSATEYSMHVFCALSGLWAGLFSLFLKLACISVSSHFLGNENTLWSTTILVIALAVVFLMIKVRSVKASLKAYDGKLFMPGYQVASIVSTIALGVIYLDDLNGFGNFRLFCVFISMLSVCTGIIVQRNDEYHNLDNRGKLLFCPSGQFLYFSKNL